MPALDVSSSKTQRAPGSSTSPVPSVHNHHVARPSSGQGISAAAAASASASAAAAATINSITNNTSSALHPTPSTTSLSASSIISTTSTSSKRVGPLSIAPFVSSPPSQASLLQSHSPNHSSVTNSTLRQQGPNRSRKKQKEEYRKQFRTAQQNEQNAVLSTSAVTASAAAAASAKKKCPGIGVGVGNGGSSGSNSSSNSGSSSSSSSNNNSNNGSGTASHSNSMLSSSSRPPQSILTANDSVLPVTSISSKRTPSATRPRIEPVQKKSSQTQSQQSRSTTLSSISSATKGSSQQQPQQYLEVPSNPIVIPTSPMSSSSSPSTMHSPLLASPSSGSYFFFRPDNHPPSSVASASAAAAFKKLPVASVSSSSSSTSSASFATSPSAGSKHLAYYLSDTNEHGQRATSPSATSDYSVYYQSQQNHHSFDDPASAQAASSSLLSNAARTARQPSPIVTLTEHDAASSLAAAKHSIFTTPKEISALEMLIHENNQLPPKQRRVAHAAAKALPMNDTESDTNATTTNTATASATSEDSIEEETLQQAAARSAQMGPPSPLLQASGASATTGNSGDTTSIAAPEDNAIKRTAMKAASLATQKQQQEAQAKEQLREQQQQLEKLEKQERLQQIQQQIQLQIQHEKQQQLLLDQNQAKYISKVANLQKQQQQQRAVAQSSTAATKPISTASTAAIIAAANPLEVAPAKELSPSPGLSPSLEPNLETESVVGVPTSVSTSTSPPQASGGAILYSPTPIKGGALNHIPLLQSHGRTLSVAQNNKSSTSISHNNNNNNNNNNTHLKAPSVPKRPRSAQSVDSVVSSWTDAHAADHQPHASAAATHTSTHAPIAVSKPKAKKLTPTPGVHHSQTLPVSTSIQQQHHPTVTRAATSVTIPTKSSRPLSYHVGLGYMPGSAPAPVAPSHIGFKATTLRQHRKTKSSSSSAQNFALRSSATLPPLPSQSSSLAAAAAFPDFEKPLAPHAPHYHFPTTSSSSSSMASVAPSGNPLHATSGTDSATYHTRGLMKTATTLAQNTIANATPTNQSNSSATGRILSLATYPHSQMSHFNPPVLTNSSLTSTSSSANVVVPTLRSGRGNHGILSLVKRKLIPGESSSNNASNNGGNCAGSGVGVSGSGIIGESLHVDDGGLNLSRVKTTMRKQSRRKSFNEDKPWKHHVDAMTLTDSEKRRYEGLWASNRGKHLKYLYHPEDYEEEEEEEEEHNNEENKKIITLVQTTKPVEESEDDYEEEDEEDSELSASSDEESDLDDDDDEDDDEEEEDDDDDDDEDDDDEEDASDMASMTSGYDEDLEDEDEEDEEENEIKPQVHHPHPVLNLPVEDVPLRRTSAPEIMTRAASAPSTASAPAPSMNTVASSASSQYLTACTSPTPSIAETGVDTEIRRHSASASVPSRSSSDNLPDSTAIPRAQTASPTLQQKNNKATSMAAALAIHATAGSSRLSRSPSPSLTSAHGISRASSPSPMYIQSVNNSRGASPSVLDVPFESMTRSSRFPGGLTTTTSSPGSGGALATVLVRPGAKRASSSHSIERLKNTFRSMSPPKLRGRNAEEEWVQRQAEERAHREMKQQIEKQQQLRQQQLAEREKSTKEKPSKTESSDKLTGINTVTTTTPTSTAIVRASQIPPPSKVYRVERDPKDDIHGFIVRDLWRRSRLPDTTLAQIWTLVDRNHDGTLDREGFLVGTWLVDQCLYGRKLPHKIDDALWRSVSRLGVTVEILKKKQLRQRERQQRHEQRQHEQQLKRHAQNHRVKTLHGPTIAGHHVVPHKHHKHDTLVVAEGDVAGEVGDKQAKRALKKQQKLDDKQRKEKKKLEKKQRKELEKERLRELEK
ncbi:uncharacterized protein SAPINGB_P003501 [Magnusiomyces paraingens]|uniref:EH domain-containing protein n=1 Tax=Magnusiomyces paraingens TaxID=2606893 RepID=A0A5E8BX48_9ASCO|nr:uncharacterized protein SAPINGB_P003501 [Saprochaete ingens]VVT53295.1 unnamed protein product [Saprochaete ingens]